MRVRGVFLRPTRLVADYSAQAIVNYYVKGSFPDDGMIAEEECNELVANDELADQIAGIVQDTLEIPVSREKASLNGSWGESLPIVHMLICFSGDRVGGGTREQDVWPCVDFGSH